MIVLIDDREKRPWKFPGVETEEAHLETGDYTVKNWEHRFAVERKSLDDLATSIGANRNRFEAEIKRAQEFNNFAVVIESDRESAESGDYYSNIHPNALMGTVEKWPWRYDKLEFIWAGDREKAAQECLRLLDKWYLLAASDLF